MDEATVARIDEAVAFADKSPFPAPESLYDHVYVLGDQVHGWYSVDERSAGVHRGEDERDAGRGRARARPARYHEAGQARRAEERRRSAAEAQAAARTRH